MQFLAKITYGCVYYPALKCFNSNFDDFGLTSKLWSKRCTKRTL